MPIELDSQSLSERAIFGAKQVVDLRFKAQSKEITQADRKMLFALARRWEREVRRYADQLEQPQFQ